MILRELVLKNRSYRRFFQDERIALEKITSWIDLGRLSASGMNIQPLKYKIIIDSTTCDAVFENLAWAGYLKDWNGPEPGERPSAYVIVLGDTTIRPAFGIDPGIAIQSILLAAVEAGYGGCIIGSVQREKLAETLVIPETLQILYVLALGKPKELVQLEEIKEFSIQYYRDDQMIHHVPKRKLEDIIIK